MEKKVSKKKTSSLSKTPPKKKAAKKKSSAAKKQVSRKNTVKKKSSAPEKRVSRKNAMEKKTLARKTRVPKKKAAKKTAPVRISTIRGKTRKPRRNKKYMDAEQLDYFRGILLSRRNELINEADRMVGYMQTGSNTYADTIDQASQEEEFTLRLKERDRERKLLRKIDEALAKIDRHEYGFCVSCGGEIGISRLKVRPTTNQCIDCKELDELRERHY